MLFTIKESFIGQLAVKYLLGNSNSVSGGYGGPQSLDKIVPKISKIWASKPIDILGKMDLCRDLITVAGSFPSLPISCVVLVSVHLASGLF